jgi:Bacterial transcriptional activator domain
LASTAAARRSEGVARLRFAASKGAPKGIAIRTETSGYAVDLDEESLDAGRFQRLLAEAEIAAEEGNPALAVSSLDRALSLWRGPALGDLAYEDSVRAEAERVDARNWISLQIR